MRYARVLRIPYPTLFVLQISHFAIPSIYSGLC
jgi:hypothetical protein